MNPEKYVKQSDMMNAILDTVFYGDGLRKRFEELKTYTMPESVSEYAKNIERMCHTHIFCNMCSQSCPIRKKVGTDIDGCRKWIMEHPEEAVTIVMEWAAKNPEPVSEPSYGKPVIGKVDEYKGWEISARFEPDAQADRIKAVSWIATKEDGGVTFEAPDLIAIKSMIDVRIHREREERCFG